MLLDYRAGDFDQQLRTSGNSSFAISRSLITKSPAARTAHQPVQGHLWKARERRPRVGVWPSSKARGRRPRVGVWQSLKARPKVSAHRGYTSAIVGLGGKKWTFCLVLSIDAHRLPLSLIGPLRPPVLRSITSLKNNSEYETRMNA